jgi:hypothetical protein
MYMQIGGNGGQVIYVYKASSGAFAYAANISASAFGGNAYGALMLVDTVAVPFASGGSKSALIERTNSSLTLQKFDAGTQIIYSNGTPAEPFRPLAFHVDWRTGGSGIYMTVTAADAETEMNAVAGQAPPASWTPLYAGVMLRNNNAGTRNWAVVDYIRRYTSGTFFPA